jgi:precorrin-6B methylase 2
MNIHGDTVKFHIDMLNDRRRTSSYLASIREIVRPGDVVLDIGTGTGIYALAAARAGARHVYAVEAGRIALLAKHLFAANGLAHRITLIRGPSTDAWLPERADVLISELIGNEPLGEHVIGITQDATERLLKPSARLIPESIKIFVLLLTIPATELDKLTFQRDTLQKWRSWYGLDFSSLTALADDGPPGLGFEYFVNPYVMRQWRILSDPVLVASIDLRTSQRPWIRTHKMLTAVESGELNGLAVYFELNAASKPFLSTHPTVVDQQNHWQSPVRILTNPMSLLTGDKLRLEYWYRRHDSLSGCEISLADSHRTSGARERHSRPDGRGLSWTPKMRQLAKVEPCP